MALKKSTFIDKFFLELNEERVNYCHWKSNAYLRTSLCGKADFDLLVSIKHRDNFEKLCKNTGFKKMLSSKSQKYPGMKDYLGFDSELGILHHLHIHFKLILGEQGIKNYWVPLEEFILSNTILKGHIRIPLPEVEFLLLLIRISLKTRDIDIFRGIIRNKNTILPRPIINEFKLLLKQCDILKFYDVIRDSKLGLPIPYFCEAIETYNVLDPFKTFLFRAKTRKLMAKYSRMNILECNIKRLRYFLADRFPRFIKQRHKFFPKGKLIAVVGADGAGKSTSVKEISEWLGEFVSVHTPYFGIPKTNTFKIFNTFLSALLKAENVSKEIGLLPISRTIRLISRHSQAMFLLAVAKSRKNIYRKSIKLVNKGFIVISDRYPLMIFDKLRKEPMDRPMIQKLINGKGNYIIQWLSKREKMLHAGIRRPHLIIALNVSLDKAHERAQEVNLDLQSHADKITAVASLKASENIAAINANETFENVVLNLKRSLWRAV
jgi:thymidylate kinase